MKTSARDRRHIQNIFCFFESLKLLSIFENILNMSDVNSSFLSKKTKIGVSIRRWG